MNIPHLQTIEPPFKATSAHPATTEWIGASFSETASTGIYSKFNLFRDIKTENSDTQSPVFQNVTELREYVDKNKILTFPIKDNVLKANVDLLGSIFIPSSILVSYFECGIEAARELVEQSPNFNNSMYAETKNLELKSTKELAAVLQRKIIQSFALYASSGIAKGLNEIIISKGDSFTIQMEDIISRDFLVKPSDLSGFLSNLLKEIYFHVSHNGKFSGSWGKMITRNSDIFLSLNGDSTPIYAKKEKAKLIKISF
jgi:hypothetical protein